jgi:hypothetical protein
VLIFIGIIAVMTCVCVYSTYNYYEAARFANAQAEKMLRASNERLYEADKIWKKINASRISSKPAVVKTTKEGGKVLQFRPLKSIPMLEDDGPSAA